MLKILVMSALLVTAAGAETMQESSLETRFQLDLRVPDAALHAFFPQGFMPNVAAQGAAKDCNLRAVFIERVTINGPDGKPVGKGSNRLVYLAAPVKDPAGANAQLVIGGITADPSDAPGPFSVYLPAATHSLKMSQAAVGLQTVASQEWVFTASGGEHLELHITYEPGVANKGNPNDVKFYSAKVPTFFQISRQEQVLDILRNVTTNPPDRVKNFRFKAGGGSFSKLFDGTEKVLSWDNILWIHRSVFLP